MKVVVPVNFPGSSGRLACLRGLEKQIEEEARSIAAMRKVLQDNYCCLDASKADLNSQIGFFRE